MIFFFGGEIYLLAVKTLHHIIYILFFVAIFGDAESKVWTSFGG